METERQRIRFGCYLDIRVGRPHHVVYLRRRQADIGEVFGHHFCAERATRGMKAQVGVALNDGVPSR